MPVERAELALAKCDRRARLCKSSGTRRKQSVLFKTALHDLWLQMRDVRSEVREVGIWRFMTGLPLHELCKDFVENVDVQLHATAKESLLAS